MLVIERRAGGRLSPNPGTLYRAIDRLVHEDLLETTTRIDPQESQPRKLFRLARLGARVAAAEAARLADQVGAARRLLKRFGNVPESWRWMAHVPAASASSHTGPPLPLAN
jgi:DNA-binding PadR family transcriptional regulator